jgi:hypothetical protein
VLSVDNLIVNPPATQGGFGTLGWIFPSEGDRTGHNVFDGFAKNITILYTPPGGVELLIMGRVLFFSVCLIYGADKYM